MWSLPSWSFISNLPGRLTDNCKCEKHYEEIQIAMGNRDQPTWGVNKEVLREAPQQS